MSETTISLISSRLTIKRMKLLFNFFGYHENYYIAGNYIIWCVLNLSHKFELKRNYSRFLENIIIVCKDKKNMDYAVDFISFYFKDSVTQHISNSIGKCIFIDDTILINIVLYEHLFVVVKTDILVIHKGKLLTNDTHLPNVLQLFDNISKFKNTKINHHIPDEGIRFYMLNLFHRIGIWDEIENIPFKIVNYMSPNKDIYDCFKYKCPICNDFIHTIKDDIYCLIPECCGRKFHYKCIIDYCLDSNNLRKIDCYKCQSNGKYELFN